MLKLHFFYQHSEAQVQAHYNRTIEELIGASNLGKLMEGLRTTIKKGDFDKLVKERLSLREPFDDSDLRYAFPIGADPDPINKQKRINMYEKRRQLLLRAAKMWAQGNIDNSVPLIFPGQSESQFIVQ